MDLILWHMNIRQRIRSCLPSLWPQQAEVPGHFRKCNLTTTGGKGVKWLFQKKHIFLLHVWTCDSIYSYIMCVCVTIFIHVPMPSKLEALPFFFGSQFSPEGQQSRDLRFASGHLAGVDHLSRESLEDTEQNRWFKPKPTISQYPEWSMCHFWYFFSHLWMKKWEWGPPPW